MKGRRFVLLAAMFAAPLVVVVACSFPSVTFGPSVGGEDSGLRETGTTDAAGLPSSDAGADAVVEDVVHREDGSAPIEDASVCATHTKCDCDDDEYADIHCDVDASGLLSKKGNPLKPGDCDDLDDLRHPDQGYVGDEPAPGKEGDWNCDGKIDRSPAATINCGGIGATGCTGGPGYVNMPGCGTTADFYTCEPESNPLATCVAKPNGTKPVQLCK